MAHSVYDLDDLKVKLEARWDGVPFWDDNEAKIAINEALMMWNVLTGFWKRRITIPTVISQMDYSLPSTMVFGMRLEYNNAPLDPTSLSEMDEGRPGWQNNADATPRKWIPLDLDTIRLWPTPDAIGTLTIDGVSATPQLTYDGETVDIGSETLSPLLGYAIHVLALKEGGSRFAATMPLFQAFLSAAAEENNQLSKSAMFRTFMGIDPKMEPTR